MKRITALLCIASMTVLMTACAEKGTDYSNQTLTGKVTAVDGTKVTMRLGELSEQETPQKEEAAEGSQGETLAAKGEGNGESDGQSPPEMTSGEAPTDNAEGDAPTDNAEGDAPPEKQSGGGESQTPPEMPSGSGESQTPPEMPSGNGESQTPPEAPSGDGESSGQTPPEMPSGGGDMTPPGGNMGMNHFTPGEESAVLDFDGAEIKVETGMETKDGSMDDIAKDCILIVETGDHNAVRTVTVKMSDGAGMPGGGFGGSGEVTQGTAANTIDSDGKASDCTYISEGDDENALRVDGAAATLSGITVEKPKGASSNTEDGDFYGMNAALLATNEAVVTITDSTITSSAQNGNGVFSYGSGTTVNISDSRITTTADNSGGIQTTGGGTTNASNLTIETSGNSSAAIRSDRGGGTVIADGGSYTSNGYNSPAVYSTADITVKNAVLTANNSEALVIEGKNSIALEDCEVSGNMSDTKGSSSDENVHNVMIYQSMSGDADVGTSTFSMTGGTLLSNNGDMFYVTNTHCILKLSGTELVQKDKEGYLLNVTGNSADRGWGTAGKKGGQVEFTADHQKLEGDIVVDSISSLDMTLSGKSEFRGTVNIVDNEQGGEAVADNVVVTVEAGSTWILTGDCTVTSVDKKGDIDFNGYTIKLADGSEMK